MIEYRLTVELKGGRTVHYYPATSVFNLMLMATVTRRGDLFEQEEILAVIPEKLCHDVHGWSNTDETGMCLECREEWHFAETLNDLGGA